MEKVLEKIAGLIERVTFHSEESGFCVIKVKVKGHKDFVTIIGNTPNIVAGEWIEADGIWVIDNTHGQQFKAEILKTAKPNDLDGIEKYLGSGLIKGIGKQFAGRLVKAFGLSVFDVIENDPEKLLTVEGIGKNRQSMITSAWHEQKMVRDIMIFLHQHGVSTSRAFRIYKKYGDESIEKVKEDPYRLARDIWGIGFKTADKIAESIGIEKNSDLRARAGIEHVLFELSNNGHCAYPEQALIEKASEIVQIPVPILQDALKHLEEEKRVILSEEFYPEKLVYLAHYYITEQELSKTLIKLQKGKHPCPEIDTEKALAWVEDKVKLTLAASQKEAIRKAVDSKVMIITGGPGVGKTTIVNSIIKVFRAKKLETVLCAPTGRAAKRLSESTGLEAKTIHRLLEFDPKTFKFKHDQSKTLKGDVFVIDECSMIDLSLAYQLIRAIPTHAAVIFVGDVDQLPSVSAGCVLKDMIESEKIPVCRLTEIFRQAQQSKIVVNAHRINQGLFPLYPKEKVDNPSESDFYFIASPEPDTLLQLLPKLLQEHLPKKFNVHPTEDIQVLTPMQRGKLGARNLNQVLQQALNPITEGVEKYGWTFKVKDKVMQMENNYDKEVFNGDIGIISKINNEESEVTVKYPEKEVVYRFQELDELILSYAMTIHKSQGSEYPVVVIPVHTQHYMMLQKNTLYTAITRGKKLVILLGTTKAIAMALKNNTSKERITTLKEQIIKISEKSP